MEQRRMGARDIVHLLYSQSGLLGVSGISTDMATLLASSDPRAKLAVDLVCYRIRREIGSLAAALEGLDSIVFTGDIGANSAARHTQRLLTRPQEPPVSTLTPIDAQNATSLSKIGKDLIPAGSYIV